MMQKGKKRTEMENERGKLEDRCGITSNVIGILEGIGRENEEESVITEIIPRQCPRAQ